MGFLHHHRPRLPDPVPLPPPPAPAPPPAAPNVYRLGLNVHALTPAHVATCLALGVRQVRTTIYDGAAQDRAVHDGIDRALAAGLDVLVVLNGQRPAEWPGIMWGLATTPGWQAVTWQLGNECEARIPPDVYERLWRETWNRVGSAARLVTAAIGGAWPEPYAHVLVSEGILPAAIAVHAYGPPPSIALAERVKPITDVLACYGATVPIWCTEFGIAPKDAARAWQLDPATFPAVQREQWSEVAVAARSLGIARAYGYCLDTDGTDGYGIDGTPTADWLRDTQRGTT